MGLGSSSLSGLIRASRTGSGHCWAIIGGASTKFTVMSGWANSLATHSCVRTIVSRGTLFTRRSLSGILIPARVAFNLSDCSLWTVMPNATRHSYGRDWRRWLIRPPTAVVPSYTVSISWRRRRRESREASRSAEFTWRHWHAVRLSAGSSVGTVSALRTGSACLGALRTVVACRTWACLAQSINTVSCFIRWWDFGSFFAEKTSSTRINVTCSHGVSVTVLSGITERASGLKSTETCAFSSVTWRTRVLIPAIGPFFTVVAFWTVWGGHSLESFAVLSWWTT